MKEIEYEEVVCPCCNGDYAQYKKYPYFKTAKEIGYVGCEWCMDTGVNRKRKESSDERQS